MVLVSIASTQAIIGWSNMIFICQRCRSTDPTDTQPGTKDGSVVTKATATLLANGFEAILCLRCCNDWNQYVLQQEADTRSIWYQILEASTRLHAIKAVIGPDSKVGDVVADYMSTVLVLRDLELAAIADAKKWLRT